MEELLTIGRSFLASGLLTVNLAACDISSGGDPTSIRRGRITRVSVAPDPVVAGDTVAVTCDTEPSYGSFGSYVADANGFEMLHAVDERCRATWVAPSAPRLYTHRAAAHDQTHPAADTVFTIRVAAP